MAEPFFLYRGDYHCRIEGRALPNGAIEVPRLPENGERWDKASGAFVTDTAVAADMTVPAGHIDHMHTIKAVEAAMILSGVALTFGLIAEEAAALGITPHDLAAAVHAHAAGQRATEIARRIMKKQGIANGN